MITITPRAIIFCLLFPVLLLGCSKDAVTSLSSADAAAQSKLALPDDLAASKTYKTYIIQKGNHYANGIRFPPFSGTVLSFNAIFDSSAIYNFTDPNTKYDQNTLYGFADNNANHRDFSARFGWRWFNGQLQIAAYTFNNSDSTIIEMGSVPLNTPISYKIAVNGNQYDFTLNDTGFLSLPRASTTATAGRYKLLPYFGGNATAPQKITIKIKDK